MVQEGDDALVLTDAAVFAVHRLDNGGAFGDDLNDAGVQLFGADRIGDNGADEGLSTRGAGTGRGILGGAGRTVGATVRGCAEVACSDATCSEVVCAEILCAGTVAVGSCSPNGSSLVCGNTQSVKIGEEAHYR